MCVCVCVCVCVCMGVCVRHGSVLMYIMAVSCDHVLLALTNLTFNGSQEILGMLGLQEYPLLQDTHATWHANSGAGRYSP
jgi:hypothetical protein